MSTSINTKKEEPGRIKEFNAHGTVPCRAVENMPIFSA